MNASPVSQPRFPLLRGPRASLGTRLTLTLLPLIILPILALGTAAYFRARDLIQQQVVSQMERGANIQAATFTAWRRTREQLLRNASQSPSLSELVARLLQVQAQPTMVETVVVEVQNQLRTINTNSPRDWYTGLMIVRLSDGLIVASVPEQWQGDRVSGISQLPLPATRLTQSRLFGGTTPVSLVTLMPISTRAGEPEAALVGVSNSEEIYYLVSDNRRAQMPGSTLYLGLPPDTLVGFQAIVFDVRTTHAAYHPVFSALNTSDTAQVQYTDPVGEELLSVYRWLPDIQTALIVEVPQSVAFAGLNTLTGFTVALVLATVVMVLWIVPWATARSIRPLATLAGFAERFARGEWDRRVPVERPDEVGRLAATFNNMADELASLYRSLEARVEARTRQIRTAAEVARDVAAARDIDRLLDETVHLISERFNFYHAGIFLIDETGEWAVLRAASSEGGRRMLQRGHRLGVGKVGIVGYVSGTGKPRIALDVGADAVHFANPDLPETRSEMALPLRIGNRIIGALDVQSQEPDAFEDADVVVLQTMADQLAVAIENVSLISVQSRRAAQRRRIIELSRQLTEELGLGQVIIQAAEAVQRDFGYDRVSVALVEGNELVIRSAARAQGIRPIPVGQALPLGQGVLGRAAALKSRVLIPDLSADPLVGPRLAQGDPLTVLAVPLLSRGQAIGALAVERLQAGSLSEEDIEMLEMLAGLVAVALENARLFDEMQQSLQHLDALYRQRTEEAWAQLFAVRRAGAAKTHFDYLPKGQKREDLPPSEPLEADIALRGEVIGKLGLEAPQASRDWTEDDRMVLEAVADEVANALEQARLLEEVHRRAAQLRIAAEIARDATALLDPDTLLARAIALIRDRFGFHYVSVFLVDDKGEYAVLREATGEAGRELKARGHRLGVGSRSIVGQVTKTGQPYVAHDVSQDPYFKPNPLLPDTRTELVLPLSAGERVIGALDVQHTRPHTFTEDEIAVLEILSDQLGVAVQNARSYNEAVRRAQREEALMEITGKIRSSRDVDTILRMAVQEMRRALGAKEAVIRLAADFDEAPTDGSGNGTGTAAVGEPRSGGA
ncbi:MAG: GAF domain-containing protein [Chloroflexota bacterium]